MRGIENGLTNRVLRLWDSLHFILYNLHDHVGNLHTVIRS